MYLVSMGYLDGFYYKPRIDKELLKEKSEGLIALTACMGGEVANNCLHGRARRARQAAREYKSDLRARSLLPGAAAERHPRAEGPPTTT
jgi:DNA polymerase III alpha subunit